MTAVVPRLPAAKQRTEVSMRMLKSLVHLLESRGIHFPAPLPKPSPITLSSYYASCRCNIRKVCTNRNLETGVCKVGNRNFTGFSCGHSYTDRLCSLSIRSTSGCTAVMMSSR